MGVELCIQVSTFCVDKLAFKVAGGVAGSTRVRITFPDNTVQNTWLRVTLLANSATGLAANDVFYFGNVIGDINVGNTASRIRVNATDTGAVRVNQSTLPNSASVTNIYDVNRDGRVNATDTGIVRTNQQTLGIVAPITAPSASGRSGGGDSGAEGEATTGTAQMPTTVPYNPSFAGGAVQLSPAIGSRLTDESYDVPLAGILGIDKAPRLASTESSVVEKVVLPEVCMKKRSEEETVVSQVDSYFASLGFGLDEIGLGDK